MSRVLLVSLVALVAVIEVQSMALQDSCYYKGQLYEEGMTWTDGCQYRCTCEDGRTGRYLCSALCLQWILPSACTMEMPEPGKCCKTPNCPANIAVRYPPNYIDA